MNQCIKRDSTTAAVAATAAKGDKPILKKSITFVNL